MKALTLLISAGMLLAAGSALACDQMGPNVHMGNVVSIDRANASFVILDAQTQQPIRFVAASTATLEYLHVNDAVKVNYEETAGGILRSVQTSRL
jgi:hypothetical protein